jgi:hypothetical protein
MLKEQDRVINISDRCDSCGSLAYVWANGVKGDLFFCAHHFNKYEQAIRNYSFEIIDERDALGS